MSDLFNEIVSLLAEGGQAELKHLWKTGQRWINRLRTAIFLWPLAMIVCAVTSRWLVSISSGVRNGLIPPP
jgi:hypothetical protein